MKRRHQTLADYAAITVAPLLIFGMLTSLAGFLMLVLYHGNYSQRVTWTLMCYTMGATALARVTIQESRSYSSAYAVALGTATFFVLLRFLGDPVFSAALILTIGYLADRIVHDCTIVDEGIDSSGQGLVDGARKWIEKRRNSRQDPPESRAPDPADAKPKTANEPSGHQPGRTVLYLAFAALPLFGIGQFFLRDQSGVWGRARWMLTLYLFTSLSLLVVTSFLNLRRYLRQRNTEMPAEVTASWLLGGVAMILMILCLAFVAPLPGQAIVSFELPEFLSNTAPTSSSRWGWGVEGADAPGDGSSPEAAAHPDAETPSGAPESPSTPQSGAPPGGESGNRDEGPAGDESGGKQASDQSDDQPGQTQPDDASRQREDSGSKSEDTGSKDAETGQKSETPRSAPSSQDEGKPSDSGSESTPQDAGARDTESPSKEPEPTQQPDDSESAVTADKPPPPDPGPESSSDGSGMLTGIAGLLKFAIIAALFFVLALYLYLNRLALLMWYHSLFGNEAATGTPEPLREVRREPVTPARPFSSFANPIGTVDAGQVVVVTFQALEAWGREQGTPRRSDETPAEYARRLAAQFPNLRQSALRVVDAYNRIVYGRGGASAEDVSAASSTWQIMRPRL